MGWGGMEETVKVHWLYNENNKNIVIMRKTRVRKGRDRLREKIIAQ